MTEAINELCKLGYSKEAAMELYQMVNPATVTKVPCEVWSRAVGYFRPVNQWNAGKREEFSERKPMNINGSHQRGC